MMGNSSAICQRSELTFKHNRHHGRHGWLRLTPAYSVKVVEGILDEFGVNGELVLEPFCGTATTPLCAAYRGLNTFSADINPFLIWLGRVKVAAYLPSVQLQFSEICREIVDAMREPAMPSDNLPPLANIERWWNAEELQFVAALRDMTQKYSGAVGDLLRVAFCRTMIGLSNVAFNHQSMSFKDEKSSQVAMTFGDTWNRCLSQYRADAKIVEGSCTDNPVGSARIERADSRSLIDVADKHNAFDLLITSPPYPNRMSYIRELRPYMYWLGFLSTGQEAGELDWEAIGGTWGIATSRLLTWKPSGAFVPTYLPPIVDAIRKSHPKNGELMAQYVHKYFDDMFQHFCAAQKLMKRGGTVHYIIGNSTFYGHLVPAERLYIDQLHKAGFKKATARAIRKRNSKKELVEFHVVAEA